MDGYAYDLSHDPSMYSSDIQTHKTTTFTNKLPLIKVGITIALGHQLHSRRKHPLDSINDLLLNHSLECEHIKVNLSQKIIKLGIFIFA